MSARCRVAQDNGSLSRGFTPRRGRVAVRALL